MVSTPICKSLSPRYRAVSTIAGTAGFRGRLPFVPTVLAIPTSVGEARATVHPASGDREAVLVLGHGAGGGIGAADLVALAQRLPSQGITVVRVEQPWRVAGRKVAARPPVLDAAWQEIIPALRRRRQLARLRLIVGGRSAGARVACRTARATSATGVLALAFPLHLPGRPEQSRAAELLGVGVPTLVIQGERDSFGGPDEFPPGPYEMIRVPGADHALAVPKTAPLSRAAVLDLVVAATGEWVKRVVD